jgi:hypothetical protein
MLVSICSQAVFGCGSGASTIGPGYHVAARSDELITLGHWAAIQSALRQHSVPAVVAAINGSPARAWWSRAVPVLRHAWQAQTAAVTLWQAPGVLVPTQWVGPSPVWQP